MRPNIRGNSRIILRCLASSPARIHHLPIDTLVNETGLSRRTVQRHLRGLAALGLVHISRLHGRGYTPSFRLSESVAHILADGSYEG